MDFESALVDELSNISALNDRIFPLAAVEGVNPPFIIYVSSEGEKQRTLSGIFKNPKEVSCELHIVADSYSEMKSLTKNVISKLETFYGRKIGIDGPYILSLDYEQPAEVHEKEVKYYRTSFDIRVKF